ncbi:MAG: hypothetical protein AB7I34_09235, partial [Rhizobiaceae bacterium]
MTAFSNWVCCISRTFAQVMERHAFHRRKPEPINNFKRRVVKPVEVQPVSAVGVDFRRELTRDFRREVTRLPLWFGSQDLVKVVAFSFFVVCGFA